MLRLTPDSRLLVVAGRALHCSEERNSTEAQRLALGPVVDIAFSQTGELFLGERRGRGEFLVHAVSQAGDRRDVAGRRDAASTECQCFIANCSTVCPGENPLLATQVRKPLVGWVVE